MGQDEEMGMSVESAMQLVRMMAAELGMVEVRVPLPSKKWAYLYLPREFKVVDAERMSAWIRAMVMEEFEPIVDREKRLEEARMRQEARYGEVHGEVQDEWGGEKLIHAHPTAKSGGKTGCCNRQVDELGEAALTTTDPKVVTCTSKPED